MLSQCKLAMQRWGSSARSNEGVANSARELRRICAVDVARIIMRRVKHEWEAKKGKEWGGHSVFSNTALSLHTYDLSAISITNILRVRIPTHRQA